MATKLKIIDQSTDVVPAPEAPQFVPAPTRNRHAGWTAERQRKFIDHLSLTGSVGEAAAIAGVTSRSAYMLRNKAGGQSFARAWDAALSLAATRLAAIAFDRALHGRSERFYKDGELVMERKMPSDYLLTWLLAHRPGAVRKPKRQGARRGGGRPARTLAPVPARPHRLTDQPARRGLPDRDGRLPR